MRHVIILFIIIIALTALLICTVAYTAPKGLNDVYASQDAIIALDKLNLAE